MSKLTVKDWKIIRRALSYAYSNLDDLNEAFAEEEKIDSEVLATLLEASRIEAKLTQWVSEG